MHHHRLLHGLLTILEYLLLNDFLLQHLVIEFKRLILDQFVVQTSTISRLNDITLGVDAILVAFLCGDLVLALELLFLLHSMIVMGD